MQRTRKTSLPFKGLLLTTGNYFGVFSGLSNHTGLQQSPFSFPLFIHPFLRHEQTQPQAGGSSQLLSPGAHPTLQPCHGLPSLLRSLLLLTPAVFLLPPPRHNQAPSNSSTEQPRVRKAFQVVHGVPLTRNGFLHHSV